MSSNMISVLSNTPNLEPSSLPSDPDLAWQLMTLSYTVMATLALFVWEMLINISNDYELLFEHRIRTPTTVYLISRLCCFGLTVSSTVGLVISPTLSNSACRGLETFEVFLFSSTTALTSLLFFFRIRAVFDNNRWIVTIFRGLWLAVLGGSLSFIIHVLTPGNAPREINKICSNVHVDVYVALTAIIPLVNDTLVFLAITWRLSCNSYARPTLANDLRTMVFGDYLSSFSKAFLHDGQAYYLTIISIQLVVVVMLFNHSLPVVIRTLLSDPSVVLMNIMACRVFRNAMLFRKYRVVDISTQLNFLSEESEIQTGILTFNVDGVVVTHTAQPTNA